MNSVEDITLEDIRKIAKEIIHEVVRKWIKGFVEMDQSWREAAISIRALSVSIEEDRRFSRRHKFAACYAHAFAEACK